MTTGPIRTRITPLAAAEPFADRPPQLNIFLTLARNKPLEKGFLALGSHLLLEGAVPDREREIVILRVGWRCGSEYEFGQHTTIGKRAGLTAAEIDRLAEAGTGDWAADDAALVAFADELCSDNYVSESTWERLAARWEENQLLELLVLAGYYRLVSGMLNSVGVPLEPFTPGWPDGSSPTRFAPRQDA